MTSRSVFSLSVALIVLDGLPQTAALALEKRFYYEGSYEYSESNDSIFFSEVKSVNRNGVFGLELKDNGRAVDVVVANLQSQLVDETGIGLREVYWDFASSNLDYTVGKKRLDWSVGYAYRPLSFIMPNNLSTTSVKFEEGAWVLSAEKFTGFGSISALAYDYNPQFTSATIDSRGFGLRVYGLLGDWELQGILFQDEPRGTILGGSLSTVIGQSSAVHGSFLWQNSYSRFTHDSDEFSFLENTFEQREFQRGYQALLGSTYNFSNKISVLTEYWYDSRSLDSDEWTDLFLAAKQQALVPALASLLNAGAQVFTSTNLRRHNINFHVRYDGQVLNPVLDIQWAPEDSGFITTLSLDYEWRAGHMLKFGSRWFGGSSSSVFQQLPVENTLFLKLEGMF